MARRAHVYPQVEPGAAALVDAPAVPLERDATVDAALRLARRRDTTVLVAAGARVVLREDLARARDLGLGEVRAAALARPVPAVDARAPEVAVRRHLAEGAPAVLVRGRWSATGVVTASRSASAPGRPPSMARRLSRLPADVQALLATIGRLAAAERVRAWLVGGVVRDLLRDGVVDRFDVDVVVEGDAPAMARRLAREIGGTCLVHGRFLTASVEAPGAGTIDVITARSERYDARGALPRVMPADIRRDLARRDFTVNAMAIELTSEDAGLLDPLGGRADLARRRLRVLHPLSLVEDPTRIFRAARYAARLGFSVDAWSAQCRTLALGLVPYPALSGQRLLNELGAILADRHPEDALGHLGAAGAFRLLDPRYRFTARTRGHLSNLAGGLAWAQAHGVTARPAELATLALLGDQRDEVARAALGRLGFTGDPLANLERALAERERVGAALASAPAPSARARVLRERSGLELAWLWLAGDAATRASLDWWAGAGGRVHGALRGDDLIALGVPRGPAVARVLDELRAARLDGQVGDREREVEHVRQWLLRSPKQSSDQGRSIVSRPLTRREG